MKRIDIDDFKILFVEYGDHLHRYAVPMHWTVAILANSTIDKYDKEKPVQLRRKPSTKYRVYNEFGAVILNNTPVSQFADNDYLSVKVEG